MLFMQNKDEYFGHFSKGQMSGSGIYWVKVAPIQLNMAGLKQMVLWRVC
jgi:hypothetical protein